MRAPPRPPSRGGWAGRRAPLNVSSAHGDPALLLLLLLLLRAGLVRPKPAHGAAASLQLPQLARDGLAVARPHLAQGDGDAALRACGWVGG